MGFSLTDSLNVKNRINTKQSDSEYFSSEAISNSDLTYFNRNGFANFWNYKYGTKPRENTPALILGSLVHCMILEPDELENRFAVITGNTPKSPNMEAFCQRMAFEGMNAEDAYLASYKTTKKDLGSKHLDLELELAGYITYLQTGKGKTSIPFEMWITANKIVENYSVKLDRYRGVFYDWLGTNNYDEVNEECWYATIEGVECKAKVDKKLHFLSNSVLLDFKTTSNSSILGFSKSINTYGYLRQLAFYSAIAFEVPPTKVAIIALQTEPPYPIQMFEFEYSLIQQCIPQIKADLRKLLPYVSGGHPEDLLTAGDLVINFNEQNFKYL